MLNKKYQQNIFVFLGIVVLALLLFWPTLEADFVNWDDKDYIYDNPVLFFFFLSLLSKVLAVTFPLVLVLIDIYQDRAINIKKLLHKLPYFLLAFAFGVLSIYLANSYETIQVETPEFNFIDRLALASTALSTYLVKFFYPYEMMALYPYPKEIATQAYALIAIPILVGGLWLWSLWKKRYLLFFGIGFFLVNIIFSLQLIPVGQGFKADRYPYIAYLGFFLLLATVVMNTLEKNWKQGRFLVLIPALLFLLLYGPMTYQQTKVWNNSQTLWTHQMKYTPANPTPYKNLADYFRYNNDPDREYQYLQQAFQLDAEDPGISYRMGMLIFEQSQFGTAEEALTWLKID